MARTKSTNFEERCKGARLLSQTLSLTNQQIASATGHTQSGVNKLLNHANGAEAFLEAVEIYLGQRASEKVNAIGFTLGQSSASGTIAAFTESFGSAITRTRLRLADEAMEHQEQVVAHG